VSNVLSLLALSAKGVRTVVTWGVERSTDAEALAQIAGFDVELLHDEAARSGSARGSASPSSTASSAGQAHP
jgi:hypothetical protein